MPKYLHFLKFCTNSSPLTLHTCIWEYSLFQVLLHSSCTSEPRSGHHPDTSESKSQHKGSAYQYMVLTCRQVLLQRQMGGGGWSKTCGWKGQGWGYQLQEWKRVNRSGHSWGHQHSTGWTPLAGSSSALTELCRGDSWIILGWILDLDSRIKNQISYDCFYVKVPISHVLTHNWKSRECIPSYSGLRDGLRHLLV